MILRTFSLPENAQHPLPFVPESSRLYVVTALTTNYLHCHNRKLAHCNSHAALATDVFDRAAARIPLLLFFSLIRPPHVVPLLALLTEHADLSNAADGEIAAGYSDLFLADVTMQVQVYLILIHSAVQLRVEDHGRRTDVILTRIVVVALIIGIVIVRGHWDRGSGTRCPRAVVITWASAARATSGEDVGIAGSGRHQG